MTDPLIDALAGWEDRNGTMAAILPDEWMALMAQVKDACLAQSPRQLRTELERLRAHITELEGIHADQLDGWKEKAQLLDAECVNLKNERDDWRRRAEMNAEDPLMDRIATLVDENARLRAALEDRKAESTRYREGLENLLCEISPPAWSDPRIPYDEVQVTKGAIEAANLALEDPALTEAMEEGNG